MDAPTQHFLVTLILLAIAFFLLHLTFRKLGKNPRNMLPYNIASRIKVPLMILLSAVGIQTLLVQEDFFRPRWIDALYQLRTLLLIFSFTWFTILGIHIIKKQLVKRFDISAANNLRARKFYTQFNIIEKIAVFIVVLLAIGFALLTFEGVREIGVSILTSAGIAGIILGLSAQKVIGTLLAGIQIAITQPIRIDDVVIVEGEWGKIEEIRLTYVVVRIWDQRRLVLPTTYFIDTPFQNWTRNNSEILGTVYLYVDYDLPVDSLREELTRLLNDTDLWDGRVNVIQVTDLTERTMEVRALMSARDSSSAWDLRVYVREHLLEFIRKNYPHSLPRSRVQVKGGPPASSPVHPPQN